MEEGAFELGVKGGQRLSGGVIGRGIPDRGQLNLTMEVQEGSAGSARGQCSGHSGKYREIRLDRHLGKVVEHFEYEIAGCELYSVGVVES